METRNVVLATTLSILVFVAYQYFFAPPPVTKTAPVPAQQEKAPDKVAVEVEKKPVVLAGKTVKIQPAVKGKDIIVETDLIKATVNTAGGVITGWELKKYREADKTEVGLTAIYKKVTGQAKKEEKPKKELGDVQLLPVKDEGPFKDIIHPLSLTPLDSGLYSLAKVDYRPNLGTIRLSKEKPSETLILTYLGPSGLLIEKSLTFYNEEYKVDINIKTKGFVGYTLNLGTDFGFADKTSSDASDRVGIAAQTDGKFVTEKTEKIKGVQEYSGTIDWFGQEDKYFTAALMYGDRGIVTSKRATAPAEIGDLLTSELMVKEKTESRKYILYAGPKSFPILSSYNRGLEQLVDYGWFSVIAKPMFWVMKFFYDITMNYGIAIILLTIVVRILLFYPSLKSALSMEEMKKIQPLVAELKDKFKKDPKRVQQETMKLYKEHKVNPLGGCLPMLLQFPFFIALYNVLSVSIELRQQPFISLWIHDLSVYDPYYILPVLMGVSMILMMKMTATTPDPQQQKIMMFMNVAFIFLFAWLPAGLLLYITLSNVASIGQQMYVHRIITKQSAKTA
jgi:YidC/Oxa1 family membrane protein insertase